MKKEEVKQEEGPKKQIKDSGLNAFSKAALRIKGDQARQRDYSSVRPDQFAHIVVPDRQAITAHASCDLHENKNTGMQGRYCDKLKDAPECFSGITSFHGNEGKRAWECHEHGIHVCEKCMQVEIFFEP